MNNVFFSVVTSAYNAQDFIKRAINSVLAQNYKDFEYVIVDNGSTDSTLKIIEEYQKQYPEFIKVFCLDKNQGISGGRNYGIQNSVGDYISFLDADDYWDKQKLKKTSEAIQEHQEYNMFCHWEYHETSESKSIAKYRDLYDADQYRDLLLNGNCLSTSAMTIKRELLLKRGGFNTKLVTGEEDYDLWLRLLKNDGKVYMIRQALGCWVIRNDSISSNVIRHTDAVAAVINMNCKSFLNEKVENKRFKVKCKAALAACYCSAGRGLSKLGDRKDAMIYYGKSLNAFPLYLKSYAGLILNLLHL